MRLLFLDIETTGLDWKRDLLHGVAYAWEEDCPEYLSFDDAAFPVLLDALEDPEVAKVGHNLRFDLRFLSRLVNVQGPLYDTMLMAQLIDENASLGLKDLSRKYLGGDSVEEKSTLDKVMIDAGVKHVGELCRLDISTSQYPNGEAPYYDIIARYAKEDVNNTLRLFHVLGAKLKQLDATWREQRGADSTPLSYVKEEGFPVEPVLLACELRGLKLNPAAIEAAQVHVKELLHCTEDQLRTDFQEQVRKVEEELYVKAIDKRKTDKGKQRVQQASEAYGTKFLLSSSQHVGKLLYEGFERVEDAPRTKGGFYSTSEADLAQLAGRPGVGEALKNFLQGFNKYRELQKLWSTYVAPDSGLLEGALDGRLYSLYLQAGSSKEGGRGGTATGRLSSQSPNMQNLPRGPLVKRFFVPDSEEHVFAYFDYSQVELRIAGHLSGDDNFVDAYRRGDDLHNITSKAVFGRSTISKEERQVGKTLNFAMIYDAGAYRLWQMLGPLGYSIDDCEEMRRGFYKQYKTYRDYLKGQLDYLKKTSCVKAETGRVRRLPDSKYGQFLDWQTKTFKGTAAMIDALKQYPTEKLSNEEIFWRAKKKFNHAVKQAYNFPIQSLGASICKRAMVELHKQDFEIITQVHDSIVIQLHKKDALDHMHKIRHTLENSYKLSVPLVAEGKLINSLDESDLYKPIEEGRRDEHN